jgi:hypothetical protein
MFKATTTATSCGLNVVRESLVSLPYELIKHFIQNNSLTEMSQKITSVSKNIRAHSFLLFPSKILFKLRSLDRSSGDWLFKY